MELAEAIQLNDTAETLMLIGQKNKAMKMYKKIKNNDNDEFVRKIYAGANYKLGDYYQYELSKLNLAKIYYSKILETNDKKIYKNAQFQLLNIALDFRDFEEAESRLKEISRLELDLKNKNQGCYELALLNFGLVLKENHRFDEACEKFKSIQCNKEIKARAIYEMGILISDIKEKYNYLENNIDQQTIVGVAKKYKLAILKRIISSNLNESIQIILDQLSEIVDSILNLISVDSFHEVYVAHYTSIFVAKKLLTSNFQKNEQNQVILNFTDKLRLSPINLVNDPSEGHILASILGLNDIFNVEQKTFISCFTLHHDSLNQFRLYGKDKLQEASGLSLVMDRRTFFTSFPQHHRISNFKELVEKNSKFNLMPLYRCIYLDATSGLIKVAQREEWSFHREYKANNKLNLLEQNPDAEKKWTAYQAEILKIESAVRQKLTALVQQVKLLNQQKLSKQEQDLLAEILLPLRYLIKHMAFKEEQECRMIYVTQIDNPLIQYDEKNNRIYIDYEPSVMAHLEKIYLAPKAKGEQMLFEYLCSRGQEIRKHKPSAKVKISQNPFR